MPSYYNRKSGNYDSPYRKKQYGKRAYGRYNTGGGMGRYMSTRDAYSRYRQPPTAESNYERSLKSRILKDAVSGLMPSGISKDALNKYRQNQIQYKPNARLSRKELDEIKESVRQDAEKFFRENFLSDNNIEVAKQGSEITTKEDNRRVASRIHPAVWGQAELGLIKSMEEHLEKTGNQRPIPDETAIKMIDTARDVAEIFQNRKNNVGEISVDELAHEILPHRKEISESENAILRDVIQKTAESLSERNLQQEIEKHEAEKADDFVSREYIHELVEKDLPSYPFIENPDMLPGLADGFNENKRFSETVSIQDKNDSVEQTTGKESFNYDAEIQKIAEEMTKLKTEISDFQKNEVPQINKLADQINSTDKIPSVNNPDMFSETTLYNTNKNSETVQYRDDSFLYDASMNDNMARKRNSFSNYNDSEIL